MSDSTPSDRRPADAVTLIAKRARRLARRATWPLRPLPDALVLGAMKAGSSTVMHYLQQHPQMRMSVRKETHYLDQHYDRGNRWYRSQFSASIGDRDWCAIESTPYYLSFPLAPVRLATVTPEAKLVVVLRDPTGRAISQWQHRSSEGRDRRSLEEVYEEEHGLDPPDAFRGTEEETANHRRQILNHGRYAEQLERWFTHFPREQFLIVDSRELFRDTQGVGDQLCDFLGLAPFTIDVPPQNVGAGTRVDPDTAAAIRAYYRPHNARLTELLERTFDWD